MDFQFDEVRALFDEMDAAQKKQFIDKQKRMSNKTPAQMWFISECVQKYNSAVREGLYRTTSECDEVAVITGLLYLPRTFVFSFPEIDIRSVSNENMYLMKDDVKIKTKISTDRSGQKIHFLPLVPYEEFSTYHIKIDKTVRHRKGKQLDKRYVLPFTVIGGKIIFQIRVKRGTVHQEKKTSRSLFPVEYANVPYVSYRITMPKNEKSVSTKRFKKAFAQNKRTKKKDNKKHGPFILWWTLMPLIIVGMLIILWSNK